MDKIKISKIAFGSLSSSIGDSTLGYSSGVTYRARDVDGIYVDNPPVLSKDYSSVIWRYCQDTDKYMMTHVQGLHVVDEAMGRFFPYRGAYEVSREEMNRTGMNVASVMDCMPRIKQYAAKETWNEDTPLHAHIRKGDAYTAECLAETIMRAFDFRSRIYIGMKTAGRILRENWIFDTEEWNTLIEAIDLLDADIRRYASFAFCVDNHYADKLDDVLLVVYAAESGMTIPQGCTNISWEALKSLKRCAPSDLDGIRNIMSHLPEKEGKYLTLSEVMHCIQREKDKPRCEALLMKDSRDLGTASSIQKMIDEYRDKVNPPALVKKISMLDALNSRFAIEDLMNDDKRGKIVTEGLQLLFINKAKSLGTNAEAWLTFLSRLTSDSGSIMERSFKIYMACVRRWSKKDIKALCNSVATYQKAHPKKSNSEAFRLMVKTLNLEKEIKINNEPKNPSNSMQEKETRTNFVAETAECDTSSFDELYQKIIKEEKNRKTKKTLIASVCSFLLGAALVGGAWYASTLMQVPEPVKADPVPAIPDSLQNDADSTAAVADSIALKPDSLTAPKPDSLKTKKSTSKK